MIRGKQLHGLRVIDKNGQELGVVQEVLANESEGRILGFIIAVPGFIVSSAFLPIEQAVHIDLAGLVISNKESLKSMRKMKKMGISALRINELTSQKGYVTDVLVENDKIEAVELSQGLVNDIREGRQTIPWDKL